MDLFSWLDHALQRRTERCCLPVFPELTSEDLGLTINLGDVD